jgi:hypothetical protein
MDRLEEFLNMDVMYTVYDEDGEFFGTVERDSNGRLYIAGHAGAVVYDTGILKSVDYLSSK